MYKPKHKIRNEQELTSKQKKGHFLISFSVVVIKKTQTKAT